MSVGKPSGNSVRPVRLEFVSYLATATTFLAVYFISQPLRRGQYLALAANLLWVWYAVYTQQFALMTQSLLLSCLSVRAILYWRRRGIDL